LLEDHLQSVCYIYSSLQFIFVVISKCSWCSDMPWNSVLWLFW